MIPVELDDRIEQLRRTRKWSARRIALELAGEGTVVSVRTVGRHLAQLGLNRRRYLDPNGEPNRTPRRIIARRPGHMVHVDIKNVGRIPDGGGWRVHGRGSAQNLAARAAAKRCRPGYSFLHTAVDGYSRLAYTEALDDKKAVTAIGFVFRARAFFAAHSITRTERIVTDNGACYKARDFAKVLLGARHQRITPYTPRHNGKVERYNRILAEESLYARKWSSDLQRRTALQVWNIHYNYHRPHSGRRKPATSQPPPRWRHQRHGLIQQHPSELLQ